jgi:hypothetical protein
MDAFIDEAVRKQGRVLTPLSAPNPRKHVQVNPTDADAVASEVRSIYHLVKPENLGSVNTVMFRYKSREAELLEDIRTKYAYELLSKHKYSMLQSHLTSTEPTRVIVEPQSIVSRKGTSFSDHYYLPKHADWAYYGMKALVDGQDHGIQAIVDTMSRWRGRQMISLESQSALVMAFSGGPGTGKTFASEVFCLSLRGLSPAEIRTVLSGTMRGELLSQAGCITMHAEEYEDDTSANDFKKRLLSSQKEVCKDEQIQWHKVSKCRIVFIIDEFDQVESPSILLRWIDSIRRENPFRNDIFILSSTTNHHDLHGLTKPRRLSGASRTSRDTDRYRHVHMYHLNSTLDIPWHGEPAGPWWHDVQARLAQMVSIDQTLRGLIDLWVPFLPVDEESVKVAVTRHADAWMQRLIEQQVLSAESSIDDSVYRWVTAKVLECSTEDEACRTTLPEHLRRSDCCPDFARRGLHPIESVAKRSYQVALHRESLDHEGSPMKCIWIVPEHSLEVEHRCSPVAPAADPPPAPPPPRPSPPIHSDTKVTADESGSLATLFIQLMVCVVLMSACA